MKKLITKDAIEIIKSKRFFSAVFTKKDGTSRYIYGRYGVKKYLKPNAKPQAYNPAERGYLTVWDMQKKEYRLINSQSITEINHIKIHKNVG
jgi:hypothetical protein